MKVISQAIKKFFLPDQIAQEELIPAVENVNILSESRKNAVMAIAEVGVEQI